MVTMMLLFTESDTLYCWSVGVSDGKGVGSLGGSGRRGPIRADCVNCRTSESLKGSMRNRIVARFNSSTYGDQGILWEP